MSSTTQQGKQEGRQRREVVDLVGMLAQHDLSQMHKIVHPARELEGSDGADDGHDNADNRPRDVLSHLRVKTSGHKDDTSRPSRESDAQPTEARADDDKDDGHGQVEPDHRCSPLADDPPLTLHVSLRPSPDRRIRPTMPAPLFHIYLFRATTSLVMDLERTLAEHIPSLRRPAVTCHTHLTARTIVHITNPSPLGQHLDSEEHAPR